MTADNILLKDSWLIHRIAFAIQEDYAPADMVALYWDEELENWIVMETLIKSDIELASGFRIEADIDQPVFMRWCFLRNRQTG